LTQESCPVGHAGEETADYLVESLPPIIQKLLSSALAKANGSSLSHTTVSDILVEAISEVDDAITRDIVGLFPDGPEETPRGGFVDTSVLAPQIRRIEELTDDQINTIVNDPVNNAGVLRGLRGSTALVSLVDPSGKNLWVASLGDCQAGSCCISYTTNSITDFVIILIISAWHQGHFR
jgi:pyruvate dehydrogenase phosphatase